MTDAPSADPVLPVFTIEQARHFHARLGDALKRRGVEFIDRGDDSYLVGDKVFGLSNLAALLSREAEQEWDRLIEHHLNAFLSAHAEVHEQARAEQVYLRVRPVRDRLAPETTAAKEETSDYPLRGLVEGMEVIFAVDHPQYVSEINSVSGLAHLGAVEPLWGLAKHNLRALPSPDHEVVDLDAGLPMYVFWFEDYFGSSRILFLPDVVDAVLGEGFCAEHGLLVATPHRHLMLVHVVEGESAIAACGRLANIAHDEYESNPGPVTPAVFYRGSDGAIAKVAGLDENGDVHLRLTEELGELMFGRSTDG